jgi:flagellar hook-basal body complex protein FliE
MTGFDLPRLDTAFRPLELPSELRPPLRPDGHTDGHPDVRIDGAGRGLPDFGGLLADAIDRVEGLQRDVRDQTQALAAGEPVALHDIMLSMGKSEVAFNLMLEVRNKLVDAWEKLSRSVV